MSRLLKKNSRKKDLTEESQLPKEEARAEFVPFQKISYNATECIFESPALVEDLIKVDDKSKVHWLNINCITEQKVIETIGTNLNLHPLVLEDILNTEQRPKIEDYGDYIFVVLKMLWLDEKTRGIRIEQISLILGANYVISFQERAGDVFNHLRERLKKPSTHFRKSGPDYLLYALLDAVVDHYFIILEKMGDYLEDTEEEALRSIDDEVVHSLYTLKRELLMLRKSIWPVREIINSIEKSGYHLFKKSTLLYLRDVYDHTVQIIETVESYRDLSASILDMHMTIVSNRMNEVMKILTIIATIFIPLTFIAGVYGMNFKFMPELEWKLGYPAILSVMALVSIGLLVFFKRKKWF